jgi:hypothetical protein
MPDPSSYEDRWRKRAKEVRAIADTADDPGIKQHLIMLAESYENLAKRAVDRASKEQK